MELSTEIICLKLKGRAFEGKEFVRRQKLKTCVKKNNIMDVIYYALAEEDIRAIRRAIKLCASTLTIAVNGENRFNAKYINETMNVLAEVITGYNADLEGKWFSALVRVPGTGQIGMLTSSKCRRVSDKCMLLFSSISSSNNSVLLP